MLSINEFRDFFLWNSDLQEDLVLSWWYFDNLWGFLLLLVTSLGFSFLTTFGLLSWLFCLFLLFDSRLCWWSLRLF